MTHTPGPWEWWTSNSWRRLRRSERGVSTNILLPMVCRDGQPDIDVSQADMKLIAAAPDLLAALLLLTGNPHINLGDLVYQVRDREGQGWDGPAVLAWSQAVTSAKSAIAKATGEKVT